MKIGENDNYDDNQKHSEKESSSNWMKLIKEYETEKFVYEEEYEDWKLNYLLARNNNEEEPLNWSLIKTFQGTT
jgi:t-SNARE complex subunit (syntaxin)